MWGACLFLVLFLLVAPTTRKMLIGMVGQSGNWMSQWAPFSYIIAVLFVVAGIVSLVLMKSWPRTPEPENPLARFKNGDDVVE